MRRSWMIGLLAVGLVGTSHAQAWRGAYENGLKALKAGTYTEARALFKQAVAYRPEDYSGPTILPGPASERRTWRDGAPYSPNFLAAYAAFKEAMMPSNDARKAEMLVPAMSELEALVAKKQFSFETFYFLNNIYVTTNSTEKRLKLEETYTQLGDKANWKVDVDGLTPEEVATINQSYRNQSPEQGPDQVPTTTPANTTNTSGNSVGMAPVAGRVQPVATKYALIIGNSTGQLGDLVVPFSADDAQVMRDALVTHGGYPEQNVDLVLNATADQMMSSAKALADRIQGENVSVFIYFSGAGANLGGRDFLAGVDTAMATDTSTMLAKTDLYRQFVSKGATVFAFFQSNRPIVEGRYFGMEIPLVGAISQTQATLPGKSVVSLVRNGKEVGTFTSSISLVLADLRSNRVPIMEFGWQVFYKMRRGTTGQEGGSGTQTPTLPVLTNMSSDARF